MDQAFDYAILTISTALSAWGLFHQLIVGGAVTLMKNAEEPEARLFVMSWVAQGALMTFCGLLPIALYFLHDLHGAVSRTVLLLGGLAMLLLSLHVILTGYRTHIRPVRIGAVLELLYGLIVLSSIAVGV